MTNKRVILSRVHQLGSLAFHELLDIKDDLKGQYGALLSSYDVESWEKLPEGTEARKLGAQLEDLIFTTAHRAESLSEWLDDLLNIDLEGF